MSVYVDDPTRFGEEGVCRMVADTTDELHEMADKIGVPRWCGRAADLYPHYNLTEEERAEAIKHGAIEVDTRKVVDVLNAMRPKDEDEAEAEVVEAEYAEIREEVGNSMDAVAELIDAAIYGSASIDNQEISQDELRAIRAMGDFDLTMLLSEINDHGWDKARKLIPLIPKQPPTKEGEA